jgi:hypothetical protein
MEGVEAILGKEEGRLRVRGKRRKAGVQISFAHVSPRTHRL